MNWPAVFEHHAQRYASMATEPAWREYARQQVRDMEASDDCWDGLLERVREILTQKKS